MPASSLLPPLAVAADEELAPVTLDADKELAPVTLATGEELAPVGIPPIPLNIATPTDCLFDVMAAESVLVWPLTTTSVTPLDT